ncbi:hypothetical protein CLF_113229 [Clonorchis sinensis]|uniref:Uncharacterized protein n=1 Tax=Clonorchis sinensis TaxID=79923 RepID=G7YXY4_CLOSI|nr:hypothetical protein CLF_113229 [Clonorchis sinensis]
MGTPGLTSPVVNAVGGNGPIAQSVVLMHQSYRLQPISEQTKHAFASKAWLYVPHSRFPVVETVAAGTNVFVVHAASKNEDHKELPDTEADIFACAQPSLPKHAQKSGQLVSGYVYRRTPRSVTFTPVNNMRELVSQVRVQLSGCSEKCVWRSFCLPSVEYYALWSAIPHLARLFGDLIPPIRVHGSCVNTKEELVAAWGDSLHNSVDGRGLRELVASPLSNRWLVFPERVFLGYLSAVSSSDANCSGRD